MLFFYGKNAVPLAPWAEKILDGILVRAGIDNAIVTSTKRSPHDQARIMYANLNGPGSDKHAYIDRQLRLYGDNGDRVIRVFEQQLSMGAAANDAIRAMERKILEIGPQKVSAHCSCDPDREVMDIAPSSIPAVKRPVFGACVANARGVAKFIPFPGDPAYHIEMKRLSVA